MFSRAIKLKSHQAKGEHQHQFFMTLHVVGKSFKINCLIIFSAKINLISYTSFLFFLTQT